jgi:hypothetical protein
VSDDHQPAEPQRLPAPPISGLSRMASGLVTVAGLGLGGWAVFKSDNELGTSTLLLVGVLAGIVTALGRIPRIKMGDHEIDPGYLVGYRAAALEANETLEEAKEQDLSLDEAQHRLINNLLVHAVPEDPMIRWAEMEWPEIARHANAVPTMAARRDKTGKHWMVSAKAGRVTAVREYPEMDEAARRQREGQ